MKTISATHQYAGTEPLALVPSPDGFQPDHALGDPMAFEAPPPPPPPPLRAVSAMPETRDSWPVSGPIETASLQLFSFSGVPVPHGRRAETAFDVLTRYGLPCVPLERPDAWAVAVGPYALHLDAFTACRIARPGEDTFAVAGHPYAVAAQDRLLDLEAWALRVALHLAGAGDPIGDPVGEHGTTYSRAQVGALEARLESVRTATPTGS